MTRHELRRRRVDVVLDLETCDPAVAHALAHELRRLSMSCVVRRPSVEAMRRAEQARRPKGFPGLPQNLPGFGRREVAP